MSVSIYSIVMGILWFSLTALIGSFLLKNTTKGSLILVGLIFILGLFRVFIPLEFENSLIIHSKHWYPMLQDWIRSPLIGRYSAGACLLIIWILGAVIRFIAITRKYVLLWKYRTSAHMVQADSKWMKLANEIRAELNYSGEIDLAVSQSSSTAYQAGFFRPFILLPKQIDAFSDDDIRNMLRHELCHFLGKDMWIKAGLQIIACFLWWHPVIYLLNKSIEQMLELRCDACACANLTKEAQYSYLETLIRLAKSHCEHTPPLSVNYVGNSDEKNLIQRFQLIIASNRRTTPHAKVVFGMILCIVLFITSYCFIIQPWYAPPPETAFYTAGSSSDGFYLIRTSEGQYKLYYNETGILALNEDQLVQEPFCHYPIYEEGYPIG